MLEQAMHVPGLLPDRHLLVLQATFGLSAHLKPLLVPLQEPVLSSLGWHLMLEQAMQVPGLLPDRHWLVLHSTFGIVVVVAGQMRHSCREVPTYACVRVRVGACVPILHTTAAKKTGERQIGLGGHIYYFINRTCRECGETHGYMMYTSKHKTRITHLVAKTTIPR